MPRWANPMPPKWCSVCNKRVRGRNTTGLCRTHWDQARRKPKTCTVCGNVLKKKNTTGFCREHYLTATRKLRKVCAKKGCVKVLDIRNPGIYCKTHCQRPGPGKGRAMTKLPPYLQNKLNDQQFRDFCTLRKHRYTVEEALVSIGRKDLAGDLQQ